MTATAHKLVRIVYLALRHGMTYVRQSQEEYEAQMKEKQIRALSRKARQLGLEVIEKTSGSVPTAAAASVPGEKGRRGYPECWARGRGRGTGQNEGEETAREVNGCARRECAPRRTRVREHLGALGRLAEGRFLATDARSQPCELTAHLELNTPVATAHDGPSGPA